VNQQLRNESLHLFYKLNIFQAGTLWNCGIWTCGHPMGWITAIGPENRKHVKRLELVYSVDPPPGPLRMDLI
jgi:hypothetical protein